MKVLTGSRLWVRLRTMSRNSWEVGTGAMSFQVVFIVPAAEESLLQGAEFGRKDVRGEEAPGAVSIESQKKFRALGRRVNLLPLARSPRAIGCRKPATT